VPKYGTLAKAADTSRKVLDLYDAYVLGPRNLAKEAEAISYILTKNLEKIETGERDRTQAWSASSSGRCLREQQFTFLGMPSNRGGVDRKNIFLNGDYLHLRYQVAGLVAGWLTDVEVPLTHEGLVKGTMDGDLVWGEVLELKSINDRGYKQILDLGPKDAHKAQATAYMLCKGYSTTRFVYENKNDNQNSEYVFELTDGWALKVREEWDRLNELTEQRKLSPMLHECMNHRGFDWRYCEFSKICEGARWPRRLTLVSD
jgi:hypothetical protein